MVVPKNEKGLLYHRQPHLLLRHEGGGWTSVTLSHSVVRRRERPRPGHLIHSSYLKVGVRSSSLCHELRGRFHHSHLRVPPWIWRWGSPVVGHHRPLQQREELISHPHAKPSLLSISFPKTYTSGSVWASHWVCSLTGLNYVVFQILDLISHLTTGPKI